MNGLTVLIAIAAAALVVLFALYARRQSGLGAKPFIAGFVALVLVVSVAVYAGFGRYADWQDKRTEVEPGYMYAAKIAEARRLVKNMPASVPAQTSLGEALFEAGQYGEAVEVFNSILEKAGDSGEILGKLAHAMYYRDSRQITEETRRVIERALALNPLEVQTRMLLGQDAFMHKRWDEAIAQWKMLLDAGVAPAQQRALRNAIANAETRARLQD